MRSRCRTRAVQSNRCNNTRTNETCFPEMHLPGMKQLSDEPCRRDYLSSGTEEGLRVGPGIFTPLGSYFDVFRGLPVGSAWLHTKQAIGWQHVDGSNLAASREAPAESV